MIPEAKRAQIIELIRSGKNVSQVAREAKLSRPSVYKILAEEREKGTSLEAQSQSPEVQGQEASTPPDTGLQSKIIGGAASKFSKSVTGPLADSMVQDLVEYLESAKIIREYSLKWRAPLADVGVEWDAFIRFCFEMGYDEIQQDIYRQVAVEKRGAQEVTIDDMVRANVRMRMINR